MRAADLISSANLSESASISLSPTPFIAFSSSAAGQPASVSISLFSSLSSSAAICRGDISFKTKPDAACVPPSKDTPFKAAFLYTRSNRLPRETRICLSASRVISTIFPKNMTCTGKLYPPLNKSSNLNKAPAISSCLSSGLCRIFSISPCRTASSDIKKVNVVKSIYILPPGFKAHRIRAKNERLTPPANSCKAYESAIVETITSSSDSP